MNKKVTRAASVLAAVAISFGLGAANIAVVAPAAAAAKPVSYKLLWSQEFNTKTAGAPDSKIWGYDVGVGVNGELEFNNNSTKNVLVDGKGHLLITANRIADSSFNQVGTSKADTAILKRCSYYCQFTSGRIKTAGKVGFKYGRMEARVKVPDGQGTWPAFWMLGSSLMDGDSWPGCGEIDILETRGSMTNAAFGTIHGPGYSGGQGKGSVYDNVKSLSAGYHTVAIEWFPNVIKFYVDNNNYFTVSSRDVAPNEWVYNKEFFLIVNLAMGGEFTGDIDPTIMQKQFALDYIRYYAINGVGKVYVHK
ncbi:MAG: glycoside hydrolase family protein [Actinomycetota bacterium]|jgi:beta-glucanase (GH16 family)